MPGKLLDEILQKKPFQSVEEEAFLNLQRTAGLLLQGLAGRLKPFELTPTQYNALRILRGAHPGTLTCGEVGERMVTAEPDITRLLDRLGRRGLVDRNRDDHDRRVVNVCITDAGLDLLADLDRPVVDSLRDFLGHLPESDLVALTQLCERARESLVAS